MQYPSEGNWENRDPNASSRPPATRQGQPFVSKTENNSKVYPGHNEEMLQIGEYSSSSSRQEASQPPAKEVPRPSLQKISHTRAGLGTRGLGQDGAQQASWSRAQGEQLCRATGQVRASEQQVEAQPILQERASPRNRERSSGTRKKEVKSENQTSNQNRQQTETNNQLVSIGDSQDDSLKCPEQYDESFVNQKERNLGARLPQSLEGFAEQSNLEVRQGAKKTDLAEKNEKRPESPFVSTRGMAAKLTISPRVQKAKFEGLGQLPGLVDSRGSHVAVVSPAPNNNGFSRHQSKLSAEAIAAKQLVYPPQPEQPEKLRLAQKQFSFSALSPCLPGQRPLESQFQGKERIRDRPFEAKIYGAKDLLKSPEHASKHVYNVQNHSGTKMNDFIDSPCAREHFNHIFCQALFSQKQACSPLKKDAQNSSKGLISAPQLVRSQAEGRFCSPSHVNHEDGFKNHGDNQSDNDARFSSNTTERYRTRCSRGSVIHSNFKINQNSLQKPRQEKLKPNKNYIAGNQNLLQVNTLLPKTLSFSARLDNTQGKSFQGTPSHQLNLSRLQFEDISLADQPRQQVVGQEAQLSNTYTGLGSNSFGNKLSTSKFGQKASLSPSFLGEQSNSPAFANPLLNVNLKKESQTHSKSSRHREEEMATPLFANNNSIFNQQNQYPSILRIGQVVSAKRALEHLSSQKFKSEEVSGSNSSSSGSSGSSSAGSGDSASSPVSESSSKEPMPAFNLSQQSQAYKYDNGLFAAMDGTAASLGFSSLLHHQDPQALLHKLSAFPGFQQMHPLLQEAFVQQQVIQDHQANIQQFNYLNPHDLAHHPFHSTATNHVPGCQVRCSCGLLNGNSPYPPFGKDKPLAGRSRANSEISISKSPQKKDPCSKNNNIFHNTHINTTMQNFYPQPNFGSFQGLSALAAAQSPFNTMGMNMGQWLGAYLNSSGQQLTATAQDLHIGSKTLGPNETSNKKQKSKKKRSTRKIQEQQMSLKRRRASDDSGEAFITQTPEAKLKEKARDKKSLQKIQLKLTGTNDKALLQNSTNIQSESWSNEELGTQVKNSRNKRSKNSRSKTKQQTFAAPTSNLDGLSRQNVQKLSVYDQITPQKNSDYLQVALNDKATAGRQKKSMMDHTQPQTLDTFKNGSNQPFDIEFSPTSMRMDKYNSNVKAPVPNKDLLEKDISQLRSYTTHKANGRHEEIRRQQSEAMGDLQVFTSMNQPSRRGHNHPPTSTKPSLQEKEQLNIKNEELIRRMTDKVIGETITQEKLFERMAQNGGGNNQCMGCKCKNTKCLKLYCECLRNKATCGPSCQCKQLPTDAGDNDECNNNDSFKEQRRNAIREILKRNISAFEDKVSNEKHFKGCKCKASACQKKYCECFERGVRCTDKCKCLNCKNNGPCPGHGEKPQPDEMSGITALRQDSEIDREPVTVQVNERNSDLQNQRSSEIAIGPTLQQLGFSNRFYQRHFDLDQDLYFNTQSNQGPRHNQAGVQDEQIFSESPEEAGPAIDALNYNNFKIQKEQNHHLSDSRKVSDEIMVPSQLIESVRNSNILEVQMEAPSTFNMQDSFMESLEPQNLFQDMKFASLKQLEEKSLIQTKATKSFIKASLIEKEHIKRVQTFPEDVTGPNTEQKTEPQTQQKRSRGKKSSSKIVILSKKEAAPIESVAPITVQKKQLSISSVKQSSLKQTPSIEIKDQIIKKETASLGTLKQPSARGTASKPASNDGTSSAPKIMTRQSNRIRNQQQKNQLCQQISEPADQQIVHESHE